MNVLSLFDGISCGHVALERAKIQVNNYFASEIDKGAIQITQKNYPDTKQLGDVNNFNEWDLPKIDLLMGGSPCQDLSIAKKQRKGLSGEKSGLFYKFVECLHKFKPKYFLLENNASMPKVDKEKISKMLGVEPILINSSLVSAQNRKRLYWTNIPNITLPNDKGIKLQEIIESGKVDREKSLCLARRTIGNQGSQSYMRRRYFGKSFAQMVFEDCEPSEQREFYKLDPFAEFDTKGRIRALTIIEMERLQTLPDNYTKLDKLSLIKRAECVGNGWTVDVIAHILKNISEV